MDKSLPITNCLRCGAPCRTGTPDPKARAIVQASKEGFCPSCMMAGMLAHTQMPEDCIDWIKVVGNWRMPWPKGREPKEWL